MEKKTLLCRNQQSGILSVISRNTPFLSPPLFLFLLSLFISLLLSLSSFLFLAFFTFSPPSLPPSLPPVCRRIGGRAGIQCRPLGREGGRVGGVPTTVVWTVRPAGARVTAALRWRFTHFSWFQLVWVADKKDITGWYSGGENLYCLFTTATSAEGYVCTSRCGIVCNH